VWGLYDNKCHNLVLLETTGYDKQQTYVLPVVLPCTLWSVDGLGG